MSNTAAANVLLPIGLAAVSEGGDLAAQVGIGVTVALGASAAMCLPISTPPNAIAFASGELKARDFIMPGLLLGLLAPLLAVLWCTLLLPLVL